MKIGLCLRLNSSRNHNTWDVHLNNILFTLRKRQNRALGYSPSEMVFGFNIRRPGKWLEREATLPDVTTIREAAKNHQQKYRAQIKDVLAAGQQHYTVGQLVLQRMHPLSKRSRKQYSGFEEKWSGPGTITGILGPDMYNDGNKESRLPVSYTHLTLPTIYSV